MLRNWPIRTKLVVVLVIPLAALATLSAIQVRGNVDDIESSDRIRSLADFSIISNDLVHELQVERQATGVYGGSDFSRGAEAVPPARLAVDAAVARYRTEEAELPGSTRESVATTLDTIDGQLDKLPGHRRSFDERQLAQDANISYYTGLLDGLLALETQISADGPNAELAARATTLASLSQAKEAAALQAGWVAGLLFAGQPIPPVIELVQNEAGAERAWLGQFRNTATAQERQFYDSTVGPTAEQIASMRGGAIGALFQGQQPAVDGIAWLEASDVKIDKLREVERLVARNLASSSESVASDATRGAWLSGVSVALVLVLSITVSLLVASPMIRQLRRLRRGALDVADSRLPTVVERLHRGEPVDVSAEVFPVVDTSRDEVGQLADAFATVHRVAVRTAVDQAAMRKSIGDTFLNLARRSQALIHRQLKIIDALERKETDPDELEELFRLDHLATRMRRHAEDLIVLSGSKPARGWRRPVPVKDVIRGAVAEVEDYTRVKVLSVTGGAISGHAVGDVIHMLAELIENATSFSPPHTPVQVSGHEVSNGCAIEVEDRGLGMTDEEFAAVNARLADPPPFDLKTSERLGLFVVGRLAERHGIQVRLRPSPYGGTMAIVLVPGSLLRPEDGTSAVDAPDAIGGEDMMAAAAMNGTALSGAGPGGGPGTIGGSGGHDIAPTEMQDPGPVFPPWAPVPEQAAPAEATSYQAGYDTGGPSPYTGDVEAAGGNSDDRPLMDDLPVFATVRSSWFITDRDRSSIDRRWPVDDPSAGRPGGAGPDAATTGPRGFPGMAGPPADTPVRRRRGAAPGGPGPAVPARDPAGPPQLPDTTDVGLPKRRRRASLAPQLRRDDSAEGTQPAVVSGPRSADEVRRMMTSFQSNFDRGLADGRGTQDGDDMGKVT